MIYFKDAAGKVHGYDETIPEFKPYISEAIASGWQNITKSWPPKETKKQAQDRLTPSITSAVNDGAIQWGYDSIESAASYINSTNSQYVAEARALIVWRDQVWEWAIPALENVTSEESVAEFLSGMPDFPTRPVV